MNIVIGKGFYWRISASGLLIFDFFLWATGNPSITGHIGLFWLTLIAILMTIAASAPGKRETWSSFILHILIAGILSVVLFTLTTNAKDYAATRLEAEINSFVKDPSNSKADVLDEQRLLMVKVKSQKYSLERENFIPTFRRMDYLFKTEEGEKYRLILTMSWSGRPEIWFHHVDN
jgi:uncharacterized membrane protein